MGSSSNVVPFPSAGAHLWIEEYQHACLAPRDAGTIRVYRHILHQFMQWIENQSGRGSQFEPGQITTPLVQRYLTDLADQGYSPSHWKRVKSVLSQFCQWALEEKASLPRNPVRGVTVERGEAPPPSVPRVLTPIQRSIFLNLGFAHGWNRKSE